MKLAVKIAKTEGNIEDLELVQLAALLHDIGDYKYSRSERTGPETVRLWLTSQHYPEEKTTKVIQIVERISFKNELSDNKPTDLFPELKVVQDADRLDAIGAIGIARAFTYGGRRMSPIWVPEQKPRGTQLTKEDYMNTEPSQSSTINHFYEKLLKLKELMKTETGRKMAEMRHQFMEAFLHQFFREWEGEL
jgi:uncharacterized protein